MRIAFLPLFIAFILTGSAGLLYAEKTGIETASPPDWIYQLNPPDNKPENDTNNEGGISLLLSDLQVNIEKEINYNHLTYRVCSEAGVQNASEIDVPFNPAFERLFFHKINVIRGKEVINKLDVHQFKIIQREEEMEQKLYDGIQTAILILDDIRPGDIIDYSYSLHGFNPVFQGKYFDTIKTDYKNPVQTWHYRFIAPQKREISVKNYLTKLTPAVTDRHESRIYDYFQHNTHPIETIDYLPDWYTQSGYLFIGEAGSWMVVKKWAAKLYQADRNISKELAAKIAEFQMKPALEDKVLAAIHFVQDEVRYTAVEIGTSSYIPNPPNRIFAQRFGDCKDKSVLLCAILKKLGVSAYPALVNSYLHQEVALFNPSPLAFNHVIVCFTLNHKAYWVDPTISYQGGSLDGLYCPDYRKALLLDDSAASLVDIPLSPGGITTINEEFNISEMDSKASVTVKTIYEGNDADFMRYRLANSSREKIQKIYQEYYNKWYPGSKMLGTLDIQDSRESNTMLTLEKYEITNFWDNDHKNNNAYIYGYLIYDQLSRPKDVKRSAPVSLNFPQHLVQNIRVKLPVEWKMKDNDYHFQSDYMDFHFNVHYTNNVCDFHYDFQSLKDNVPVEKTSEYLSQLKEIDDSCSYQFTYNKKGPLSLRFSYMTAVLLLLITALIIYLCRKTYLYNPKPRTDALVDEKLTGIHGWLLLVGLGSALKPLLFVFFLYDYYIKDYASFKTYFYQGFFLQFPYLFSYFIFEFAMNISLLTFSLLAFLLFMKKRSSFPRVFIITLVANIIFLFITYFNIQIISPDKMHDLINTTERDISRLILSALIWIPYLTVSKRVKNTFTERLENNNPEGPVQQTPDLARPAETSDPIQPGK